MNKLNLKLVILMLGLMVLAYVFLPDIHSTHRQTSSTVNATTAMSVPASQRPIGSLADLNNAFVAIAAEVKPTVVTVFTEKTYEVQQNPMMNPFFNFFGDQQGNGPAQQYKQEGMGSGVIVSSDGRILTNNHVIANADSIYVRTSDKKQYTAKIIGADPKTDVAVIKIDAMDLPVIKIGNSDSLRVGEMVMAVGSPLSENLAQTVTQGIVSATGRSNIGLTDSGYEDFIQTDAAINPGNSGGALVNMNGELVGLNSAIATRSGGFQGISFAVPSNMAVAIMNSLLKNGKVVRGWLGVTIQDISNKIGKAMDLKSLNGALIGDVLKDSPASKAGLQAGDVVETLNGNTIDNSSTFRSAISSMQPGTEVKLGVVRDGKPMDITVKLGEMPSEGALAALGGNYQQLLGFKVSNSTSDLTRKYGLSSSLRGVIVTSIDKKSSAALAGLEEGDMIFSINRQRIENVDEFAATLKGIKKGDTLLMRIQRGDQGFFLAFTL